MADETEFLTFQGQHPLKNYVIVSKLFDIINQSCTTHWGDWGKHEMVNLSFICAEWANEARKYIHQRDEEGRYFFLDAWLRFELDRDQSVHTVFDGTLTFLNISELILFVNGPCPVVEVPSQVYPGPESKYELTPEEEVSESEAMLRAFPKLTALILGIHICPVLLAIMRTFTVSVAAPPLEFIYLVLRSEWMTEKIVAQYPLLMQPYWIQMPIRKNLLLLNNCSTTLEELEITELTGHIDSHKMIIAFSRMPRLQKIKLVQMQWPLHICYRYFTPQVQDDDPAIQFPVLELLLFDGVQCYQSSAPCYDLAATLFMIEALSPSDTKPCESLKILPILSRLHDAVWKNDEDVMRLLPPPSGHLEDKKHHLYQASPSTIARFKGKLLSKFPNLATDCEDHISSI
ncbi:hypothetical protein Fcan01_11699 [Folsomia candida]|uniref:Uncharacterized protein n=1 Tax=Folsomia candida TaxID=158441 RepID=A0A226EBR1_FOLCA|nr:hypothetical protein Fcan01_11699 [Folsomia candida]